MGVIHNDCVVLKRKTHQIGNGVCSLLIKITVFSILGVQTHNTKKRNSDN